MISRYFLSKTSFLRGRQSKIWSSPNNGWLHDLPLFLSNFSFWLYKPLEVLRGLSTAKMQRTGEPKRCASHSGMFLHLPPESDSLGSTASRRASVSLEMLIGFDFLTQVGYLLTYPSFQIVNKIFEFLMAYMTCSYYHPFPFLILTNSFVIHDL
jgi:hypothetical protein